MKSERKISRSSDETVRQRILDNALRLLARAGPADLLSFIGPKRAAAAAGASVGGLYHHWPEGAPAFAADLALHAREASATTLALGMAEADGFDDLADRLVVAVRAAPGAAGLDLVAPGAGAVGPAVEQLLDRAGRTPRPPWTADRIASLLAGLAVGVTAVDPHPEALLADAVRLVLISTCAGAGDLRPFNAALSALDGRTAAMSPRSGWSVADRIPSVRLGLGGSVATDVPSVAPLPPLDEHPS